MKILKVSISEWPGKYYPISATFTLNKVRYQLVFETVEEAKRYFRSRYYPIPIKYTTKLYL